MYEVTERFLDAIGGSHRAVVRARIVPTTVPPQFTATPTDERLMDLPINGGSLKLSSTADINGTGSLSVPGDYWGELQPYGVEVFLERGVDFGDDTTEMVPLGYYRVEEITQDRAPYGQLRAELADRMAQLKQNRVLAPVQFPAGTTHRAIFNRLVNGNSGAGQSTDGYGMFLHTEVPISSTAYDLDRTTISTALVCEDDAHDFLSKLVDSENAVARFDRLGRLVVEPRDRGPAEEAVYTVRPGQGGNLVSASRKVLRAGVYNVVVARGSDPAAPTGYQVAVNGDQTSPLWWAGRFGTVPRYYASPLLRTDAAARDAAATVLARYKGLPSSLSLFAVPNPALDPLDVVAATIGNTTATHLLDEVEIPLVRSSPVSIVTRTLNEIPTDDETGGGDGGYPIPNPGDPGNPTDPGTPSAPIYPSEFPDGTPYPEITGGNAVVEVSSLDALAEVANGARVVLAGGEYSGDVTISGKEDVTIEAAAGVDITSGTIRISDCANLVLDGFRFPFDTEGDVISIRGTSHHVRITRCTIGPSNHPGDGSGGESGNYIYVGDDCHNVRIDHCELRNKSRSGNGIRVYGNFDSYNGCRHIRIDHNYIHDFYPAAVNDFEPIRLGVSTMSRTDTNSVVERNVFRAIKSEPEIISLKMGRIRCTGNVLLQCAGGPVIRHGRGSIMADNYVIDGQSTENGNGELSGGPRFYDADHEVAYNLMQGLAGTQYQAALLLDSGDAENDGDSLSNHWRVIRAKVHHNVLAGCATSIQVGNNYDDPPQNCTVTDNLVAASGSEAVTYVDIEPGSIGTVTGNTWHETAVAAGLIKDADGVYRKAGVGPRVSYLAPSGVGPNGDTDDLDGTGVPIASSGGGTPDPGGPGGDPADMTTAAGRHGWGVPLDVSDEFDYTGAPDPAKWALPGADWAGHNGNGTRDPERTEVRDGKMIMTGLANGASGWVRHKLDQEGGRWEARCRSFANAESNGNDYHPLLLIWPESNSRQTDGEYDFLENGSPGEQTLGAFMHYPHPGTEVVQQEHFEKPGVDLSEWHNIALEWVRGDNGHLKGFLDGEEWFSVSGGANDVRRDIQDMPSGHLNIQLDNFDGTDQTPATFEIEWVRAYTLTPQFPDGGGTGSTPGELHKIGGEGGNHFNLGVGYSPGDAPGTDDADHVDYPPDELAGGLIIPGYYELNPARDGVRMSAHLDGGRTSSNTKYPRTEYRELTPDGGKAKWSTSGGPHTLEGEFAIHRMPPNKPQLTIMQIHDGSDDVAVFRMEDRNELVAKYGDSEIVQVLTDSLQFGQRYRYKFVVEDDEIRWYFVDMNTPAAVKQHGGSGNYFKIGTYGQSNDDIDAVEDGPFIMDLYWFRCWHPGYPEPR